MLLLQLNLPAASGGVSASSATTDGADVTAAQVGPVIAASSAKTDGADLTAASVGPVVAASSAKTDGADVTAASVGPVVGASAATIDGADITAAMVDPVAAMINFSSATTDGADTTAASASPTVGASSASADGADLTAAAVSFSSVVAPVAAGTGSKPHDERYGLTLDAQIAQANASRVISALAIQQVDKPVKTAKRNRQLRRELGRSGVQWNAFYAGLLTQARDQVLTEQIRAQFDARQLEAQALQQQIAGLVAEQIRIDDDEAIALLLCL